MHTVHDHPALHLLTLVVIRFMAQGCASPGVSVGAGLRQRLICGDQSSIFFRNISRQSKPVVKTVVCRFYGLLLVGLGAAQIVPVVMRQRCADCRNIESGGIQQPGHW